MRLLGLTGGIAAGKSTVGALLVELGWPLVDADALAREVVAPGSDGLRALVHSFGAEILDNEGALDRAALGRLVFDDPAARERLEGITHPAIAEAARERFASLAAEGHPWAVYEAALLVEAGRHGEMDRLLVVVAAEEQRLERIQSRDGLSLEAARKRLAAQWPQERKAALADHVIDNSSGLDETRIQVVALHAELMGEAQRRPGEGDS